MSQPSRGGRAPAPVAGRSTPRRRARRPITSDALADQRIRGLSSLRCTRHSGLRCRVEGLPRHAAARGVAKGEEADGSEELEEIVRRRAQRGLRAPRPGVGCTSRRDGPRMCSCHEPLPVWCWMRATSSVSASPSTLRGPEGATLCLRKNVISVCSPLADRKQQSQTPQHQTMSRGGTA